MELRRYLEIFNRRKRIFYFILSASVILSLLMLILIRPTYKASAKVLITKAAFANGLLAGWGLTSQTTAASDDVKTDVELSRVKPLAQAVIDEYKLKGLFGSPLKADDFFEPSIAENLFSLPYSVVKQYKEAAIIEISAVSRDPELSVSIANTLSARYIEDTVERVKADFKSARESIESKLESIRDDYYKTLALATGIKLRDKTVDLTSETTNLIETISTLKTDTETADKEIAQYEAEISKGVKQLKELSLYRKETFEMTTNSRLDMLKITLDKKIAEQASQKIDITKEHPKYKALNDEIEAIKRQMSEEVELVLSREIKSVNPLYTDVSKRIITNYINKEAVLAKKIVMHKFMKQYEEKLIKIPVKYEEIARVEPVLAAQKEMYMRVNQYAIQAALAESMNLSKLKIIERATTPKKRFYPKRGRTLVSAVLLGLFLGTAAMFFTEYMDNTVKSKADISAPSKLLGRIPHSEYLRNYDAFTSPSFIEGNSKEVEAINEIKDNIFYINGAALPLIVTSPKKGDGKTCAASLLAIAYAREGRRVLLAGANGPAAFFGMTKDISTVPISTREPGLEVLLVPDIAKANEVLSNLRDAYDHIVIDTGSVIDCAALDGRVICVVEPYKYEKDTLDRVQGLAHFTGFVFNKDKSQEKLFGLSKKPSAAKNAS
ncbi:GumC family protein [Candidatus Magnetominusculus xianensis]|uniref:Sugar tyrosine-protein kinase n=1 Tax=Candidatus Magnetominusculus xianensis TaxID=1748249 RepID=A0ABR5SI94_9BACT|nr:hypothetical protein [Candidatus Magnetominusculus xianensis]KWT90945.1 sugar tyrosine-protein kinase [Candidatus Magnetominusculus xianensis]MBF0403101.1 hypothetical protein [Nitrospirota bacterium]